MNSEAFKQTLTEVGYRRFTEVMRATLRINQDTKGDSWVTCDIEFLEDKLLEEIKEYLSTKKHIDRKREVIDIANVCMMLYNRHFGAMINRDVELMGD